MSAAPHASEKRNRTPVAPPRPTTRSRRCPAAPVGPYFPIQPFANNVRESALQGRRKHDSFEISLDSRSIVRKPDSIRRGDSRGASHAGWVAILFGAGFMSCAAIVLLLFPKPIVRIFSSDPQVLRTGTTLLALAAMFQLFDGIQTVVTGALRGAGDTRTPMICHLLAYWLVGLPLGYFLCFRREWGAAGLWAGLSVALILIGSVLLMAWKRQVRQAAAVFPVNLDARAAG